MTRWMFYVLIGLVLASSCDKDDPVPEKKDPIIQDTIPVDTVKKDTVVIPKPNPDSVTLIKGGFMKIERDEATKILNDLRNEGCSCKVVGKPDEYEWHQASNTLEWDSLLEKSALRHTLDMIRYNFIGHTGSDGSGVRIRSEEVGFESSLFGENLARGHKDTWTVFHGGWKLSETGHCQTQMRGEFKKFALAKKENHEGRLVWTLVLAK